MGTDVFGVFQERRQGRWLCNRSLYNGHRGHVRAWLGVNSFRGAPSFEVIPLVSPRGLPDDFDTNETFMDARRQRNVLAEWVIGEWGHSWLLSDEILDDHPVLAKRHIEVPAGLYAATWNTTSDVEQWRLATGLCQEDDFSQIVSVSYLPDEVSAKAGHVRAECIYDLSGSDEIAEFKEEVLRLQGEMGQLRFVYGFS